MQAELQNLSLQNSFRLRILLLIDSVQILESEEDCYKCCLLAHT